MTIPPEHERAIRERCERYLRGGEPGENIHVVRAEVEDHAIDDIPALLAALDAARAASAQLRAKVERIEEKARHATVSRDMLMSGLVARAHAELSGLTDPCVCVECGHGHERVRDPRKDTDHG